MLLLRWLRGGSAGSAPALGAPLPHPEQDQHQEGEGQDEELYEHGPVEAVELVGVPTRRGAHIRASTVTSQHTATTIALSHHSTVKGIPVHSLIFLQ